VRLARSLLAASLLLAPLPAGGELIDRVVATVNGEAITLHELQKAALSTLGQTQLPARGGIRTPRERELERQVLERLIEDRLVVQRARELGLTVTVREVDAALETLRQEGRFSPEEFQQSLRQRGFTPEDYRRFIGEEILKSKAFNEDVRQSIVVTPEEVTAYYDAHRSEFSTPERVTIRHLLVLKEGRTVDEARARAQAARDLLESGRDFQEVAQAYSQDSSKVKGEISGWLNRGDTLPELEEVLFSLRPGQVSPPIETNLGFHLVRQESREAERVVPREEVAPVILDRLREEKTQQRLKDWLQGLRERGAVSVRL
jgi:peptidyl-prolyl cis-trans isomerase SurA